MGFPCLNIFLDILICGVEPCKYLISSYSLTKNRRACGAGLAMQWKMTCIESNRNHFWKMSLSQSKLA